MEDQGELDIKETVVSTVFIHHELKAQMDAWKETANNRPLRVLICGLEGAGKSTLVNHLLQLKGDEKWAKEARKGMTSDLAISKYERATERGIKVSLFDAPGFNNLHMSNEELIAMMENETENKLDMILYCISLDGPARVQRSDVQAFKIMTQAFSNEIWKKTIIVLTFANVLEKRVTSISEYVATTSKVREKVQQVLRNDACVREDIVNQLLVVTAGHTEQILKYEAEECKSAGDWENRLFLKGFEHIETHVQPPCFEARLNWRELHTALSGGMGRMAVGGTIGAGIGAAFGAYLGVIASGIGAFVGGGIGTGIGGTSIIVFQLIKIWSILKIKYEKWRMKIERQSSSVSF